MSDTVRSYGYIAELCEPIADEKLEEINGRLYASDSILRVNDEGTLVYSDHSINKKYSERTELYGLFLGRESSIGTPWEFADAARAVGLKVGGGGIAEPYNCIWYNGADSPVNQLTLEEFNQRCNN